MSEPNKSTSSTITPEQRARIEQNRLKALEIRNSRKALTNNNNNNRYNPYQRPNPIQPSPNQPNQQKPVQKSFPIFAKPSTPVSKPATPKSSTSTLSVKPSSNQTKIVKCLIVIQDENRFIVKTDSYSEKVIDEFRKINSSVYSNYL